MKMRLTEDYYFWCCDWCDSENRVFWTKLEEGPTCGACHKPMNLLEIKDVVTEGKISAGLC